MYHVYSSFTILCDGNRQKSAPTFSSASQAGYPRRHVETLFWIFGDFIPFINQDVGSFFLYFCFCAFYIWFSEIPATCRLLFCISCFRLWAFLLRREISVAVGGLKNWGGGGGMRKQGSTPDLDGYSSGNPRPCKVSFNIVVHLCSWGECLG